MTAARLLLLTLTLWGIASPAARAGEFDASAERLRIDLETLCANGPRVEGSPALEAAQAYVETELRRAGYAPRREPVEVEIWDAGRTPVRIHGPSGSGPILELTALGRSPALLPGRFELMDLGWGTAEDFEARALRIPGRVLLIQEGWPEGADPVHRLEKLFRASDAGATAVIFHHPAGIPFRGLVAWPGEARIAGLMLDDGRGLQKALLEGQRLELESLREEAMPPGPVPLGSANLIAESEGSAVHREPLLLCAHLDAWDLGEGALDDAAGVAVVLEVARILGARRWQGRRPVRYGLFSGEEMGLLGSRAHLESCREGRQALPALVLNLEMPEAPSGFVIHRGAELRPLLAPVLLEQRALGLQGGIREQLRLHSDHLPFLLAGVASLAPAYHRSEDADRRIHTAEDRRSALDAGGLARCAQLVAATLWALSDPLAPLPGRMDEDSLRSFFSEQGLDFDRARSRGY